MRGLERLLICRCETGSRAGDRTRRGQTENRHRISLCARIRQSAAAFSGTRAAEGFLDLGRLVARWRRLGL